jgi:hypothetical protein
MPAENDQFGDYIRIEHIIRLVKISLDMHGLIM